MKFGFYILMCIDLNEDIFFAQNALAASNGTDMAFKMIFDHIENKANELRMNRKQMSEIYKI